MTHRVRNRCIVRFGPPYAGHGAEVFFFFSNRLGCLGSLLVSALLTLILLLAFDVL